MTSLKQIAQVFRGLLSNFVSLKNENIYKFFLSNEPSITQNLSNKSQIKVHNAKINFFFELLETGSVLTRYKKKIFLVTNKPLLSHSLTLRSLVWADSKKHFAGWEGGFTVKIIQIINFFSHVQKQICHPDFLQNIFCSVILNKHSLIFENLCWWELSKIMFFSKHHYLYNAQPFLPSFLWAAFLLKKLKNRSKTCCFTTGFEFFFQISKMITKSVPNVCINVKIFWRVYLNLTNKIL